MIQLSGFCGRYCILTRLQVSFWAFSFESVRSGSCTKQNNPKLHFELLDFGEKTERGSTQLARMKNH